MPLTHSFVKLAKFKDWKATPSEITQKTMDNNS